MGNVIDLPNITFESLIDIDSKESKKKTSDFDVKNYLNTRLENGQKERKTSFRLLPMDLTTGNPFLLIHTHTVDVPVGMRKNPKVKEKKQYICLSKNNLDKSKYGDKCPFCELNKSAYDQSVLATNPQEKKMLQEISINNITKQSVICRGIERGKESDGVKYWKFNLRFDKTDPYHRIMALVKERAKEAEALGKTCNILDMWKGRDLNITFNEGTAAPTIWDASFESPITEDVELLKEWIYNSKKWNEVFGIKPYEYLSLIAEGKTPWFDRETKTWVGKESEDETTNAAIAEIEEKIEKVTEEVVNIPSPKQTPVPTQNIMSDLSVNDDDLPF